MISYDTYQNKIKRVAAVKNFIVRFRALFISLFAVLIALIAAFIFTKGIITQDVVMPDKIVYGDSYSENIQRPKALFSSVSYQFKRVEEESAAKSAVKHAVKDSGDASDGWTYDLPTLTGKYFVRTVSNKTFGKSYGDAKQFEIEPYSTEFVIESDSITYGEMPDSFSLALVNGDRLDADGVRLDYENPALDLTNVCANASSFTILNDKGEDVTFCYDISAPQKEVTILPKDITLSPETLTFTYDGTPQSCSGIVSETSVAALKGDTASIGTRIYDAAGNLLDGEPVDAGVYRVEIIPEETAIFSGETDVLKHYNVSYSTAFITIAKRPVTVETKNIEKTYDGLALFCNDSDYTVEESALVVGHTHGIISSRSIVQVKESGAANEIGIKISAADGKDVTENYDIKYVYGKMSVKAREVLLTSASGSWVYDGNAHSNGEISSIASATGGNQPLADGETIFVSDSTAVTDYTAQPVKNELVCVVSDGTSDTTSNYVFTLDCGDLIIEKRPLGIATLSGSDVYDGAPFSFVNAEAEEYDESARRGLCAGHEIRHDKSRKTASVTYVTEGAVENELYYLVYDIYGNEVTDNYEIDYVYGEISVTKRDVTIYTASVAKVYDGTPLFGDDDSAVYNRSFAYADNLAVGEGLEVKESAQLIAAGEAQNLTTYRIVLQIAPPQPDPSDDIYSGIDPRDVKENFETTENYNISYVYGTITVKKRIIVIQTATDTKEYDGQPLSNTENWTIITEIDGSSLYDLVENHTLVPDENNLITSVTDVSEGEKENRVSYKVFSGKDEVSDNYTLAYTYGKLSVTPRNVKVVTQGGEWFYDNAEHSNPTATAAHVTYADGEWVEDGEDALVLDHTLVLTYEYKVTVAGNHDNICSFTVENSDGESVILNYNFIHEYGKLLIKPRPIIITTRDGNDVYDDTPFEYTFADAEEYGEDRGICSGHEIKYDESKKTASVTYVTEGKVENEHYYIIIDSAKQEGEEGYDVSDNYDIEYVYGEIFVTPRPITITTATSSKEFDGTAYSDDSRTVQNLVDGHSTVVASELPTVTFVTEGRVKNEYVCDVYKDGVPITENYDIGYEYGYVSRTVRYVQIQTWDGNWIYDGELHSETRYDDAHLANVVLEDGEFISGDPDGEEGLVLGHALVPVKFNGVIDYTQTPNENKVEYIVENEEINLNYYLHVLSGELSISKRPVIVTTPSKEKVYDGDKFSHYTDGFSDEGGTVVIEEDGEQKEIKLGFGLVDGHELRVRLNEDGTPQTITEVTDVKRENGEVVGYENKVVYDVFDVNENVSANYDISYIYGTLTRTPRPIDIETGSAHKTYDGTKLECDIYDFERCNADNTRGLLEHKNHAAELDAERAVASITYITFIDGTETDSAPNERYYRIIADGEDKSGNYEINYIYGTLKIDKRALTVKTATLSWDYDGKYHYGNEEQETENGKTAFDNLASVDGLEEFTEAYNVARIIDYTENGAINDTLYRIYTDNLRTIETTYCYDIVFSERGKLFIKRIPVHITTITASKIYDGTPLRGDDEDYGKPIIIGLIEGETYRSSKCTIRNCGSIKNVTIYAFFAQRDEEVVGTSKNYVKTYTKGTLTVIPREITIQTATKSHEYDGEEFHYTDEWSDIGNLKLVKGHTLEVVSYTGKITDVGEAANEVTYKVVENGDDSVNSNYIIHYVYGKLTVTPRNILITTASASWIYDGDEHFDDGYEKVVHISDGVEDSEFALVLGHELKAVAGTATIVKDFTDGKVTNEVKFIVTDDTVNKNYNISYTEGELAGKLEITKRPVNIKTFSDDKEYDGTPLSCLDFEAEQLSKDRGLVLGHKAQVDTSAQIAEVTYVHEGKVENVLHFIIMCGSEDVTRNYQLDGNYEYGILFVTPHRISVTNPTRTKTYDGEKLTGEEITIFDGKLLSDDVCEEDVVSEITFAGKVNNDTTYKVKNAEGTYITDSYDIVYNYGATLSVSKRTLTITTATLEKVYDGTPLYGAERLNDENTFTVIKETEIAGLVGEDQAVSDKYIAKRITDVQTGFENETKFRIVVPRGELNLDISDSYDIGYTYGTLTVKIRDIIIATATAYKDFDGTALTDTENYNITSPLKLAEGHSLYVKEGSFVASVTYFTEGSVDNRVEYSVKGSGGNDVTQNYGITYYNMYEGKKYGTLTIYQREISLTSLSNEWEYDGGEHFEEGYINLKYLGGDGGGALVSGHELLAVSNTKIRNVGSADNLVEYIVENSEITKNYKITYNGCGTLTVRPRELSIELYTVKNTIYGDPFTGYPADNGFEFAAGSKRPVDGETLEISVKYRFGGDDVANPVNAGRYEVVIADKRIVGGDIANYSVTVKISSFEIIKRAITINLLSAENGGRPYNGRAFEFPVELDKGYELVSGSLAEGDTLNIAVSYFSGGRGVVPLNAGIYTIVFERENCTVNGSKELTENYSITCGVSNLPLEITRLPLTFKLNDLTHAYVGDTSYKFENDAADFDFSQLAETDYLKDGYFATMLDGEIVMAVNVGVYDSVLTGFRVLSKADDSDVSQNYYLSEDEPHTATLTITPREINLKVQFEDGATRSSREYANEVIDLKEVFAPYGPYTSEPVKADSASYGIYARDYSKLNASFTFTKNGSPAELKELGEYKVFISISDKDGEDVLKNYKVVGCEEGDFAITKRQVNVIPEMIAKSLEYDGGTIEPEYLDYYTKHNFSDAAGFLFDTDKDDYDAVYSLYKADGGNDIIGNILQAGEYFIKVKLTYKGAAGQEKYLINDDFVSDTFTVNKRLIYVTAPDDETEYIYNKTAAKTPPSCTAYYFDGEWVADSGFVNDDGEYAIPVYGYYKDGQSHLSAIDAGEYSIKVDDFATKDGAAISIGDNYSIVFDAYGAPEYGKLYIKPAVLVVVPKAYSQDFDGTKYELELPSHCYEIKYVEDIGGDRNELFDGDILSFTASDSVNIRNTFLTYVNFTDVKISESDGRDITSNYDIVFTYESLLEKLPDLASEITRDKFGAILKFNQIQLKIKQPAPPDEYKVIQLGTSEEIVLDDYSVAYENILNPEALISGHRVEISLAMAIGMSLDKVKKWVYRCEVYDGYGEDVTLGYNITIESDEESYITVVPKDITVSINYPTTHYDENDILTAGVDYLVMGEFVFGETIAVSFVGGEFVASVTSYTGADNSGYYNLKFVYPDSGNTEKEVE